MSAKSDPRFELAERFLLQEGDAAVKAKVTKFNLLRLPKDSTEAKRCNDILGIMRDYSKREDPPRPLSIAMFGPPGSGKSFTVEQLAAEATGYEEKPTTINLSQLDGPSQLAESLLHKLSSRGTKTPLILFDEFDAALNGQDLGWLKWFLAPMQDAVFFHKGQACPIPKAVFFFAGGTAERFEEFQVRHADYFIPRKGPDFISRLRGTLNIEGVNTYDSDRILRRSLVLQIQIKKRNKQLCKDDGTLRITKDTLRLLLDGGYYTHGARSMEALLDMSQLTELTKASKIKKDHLPKDPELRKLHVSRGPLDGRTIGISAGLFVSSTDSLVAGLAKTLINRGATLAYAGTLGDTLESILDAAEGLTDQLVTTDPDYRIWNPLPYPGFLKRGSRRSQRKKIQKHVKFDRMQTLSVAEMTKLELPRGYFTLWADTQKSKYKSRYHLAWALSLFRMRVRLIQGIDALVVAGGKGGQQPELKIDSKGNNTAADESNAEDMPWGRFPGVAEEVMLALSFGKPVYVLGMSQGAAKDIGILLGLSRTQLYASSCLPHPEDDNYAMLEKELEAESNSFQVLHQTNLPQNFDGLRAYFCGQALGSKHWPENGLTSLENRELFNAQQTPDDIERCIQLIVRGIKHLDWARPAVVTRTGR